jgi:hypothetical protein
MFFQLLLTEQDGAGVGANSVKNTLVVLPKRKMNR